MRLISTPASGVDTRTGQQPVLSVFVFAYPPAFLNAGFTAAYNLSVTRTAPASQPPGGEGDTAPLFGGVGELGVGTNIATLPVGRSPARLPAAGERRRRGVQGLSGWRQLR